MPDGLENFNFVSNVLVVLVHNLCQTSGHFIYTRSPSLAPSPNSHTQGKLSLCITQTYTSACNLLISVNIYLQDIPGNLESIFVINRLVHNFKGAFSENRVESSVSFVR